MAFHDDLKKLYDLAGVQNQHTVFLFTDTQVNLDTILVFNQKYMNLKFKKDDHS